MATDDIRDRASFDLIRYANVWEDADVLCEALDAREGKRFASIASGGDNAFALVAEGAEVVAADISLAQLHVVELKRAAILALSDEELLTFLGIRESVGGRTPSSALPQTLRNSSTESRGSDPRDSVRDPRSVSGRAGEGARTPAWRLETYDRLWKQLSPAAQAYWDRHRDVIARGIVHAGKFERYFRTFRTRVLPLVHSKRDVAELLAEKSPEERKRFYRETWDNRRWRAMFAVFFSRFVMGQLGRDPEFFRYVEGSVADRIRSRAEYAMTELPTHSNPYLTFIFTGNYGDALPRYLRPEKLKLLRERMARLELVNEPVDEVVKRSARKFDGYNLSDIFEYLDPPTSRRIYETLLDGANPRARFVYWNMLVPRSCPPELQDRVAPRTALSSDLFARDLAFFYSRLVIEEVRR